MLYFTADTHFSHRRIPVYTNRRFCLTDDELTNLDNNVPIKRGAGDGWVPSDKSLVKHDDYLIDRINETVGENDTLWHLGDFCFGPRNRLEEFAWNLRKRIRCKNIFLCWGNHDRSGIAPIFTRTYQEFTLNENGQRIRCAHEAKLVFYHSHRGAWHLYGHSHTSADVQIEEFLAKAAEEGWEHRFIDSLKDRRALDVGVDNAFRLLGEYRPFSFDDIRGYMEKKTGTSIDMGKEI
jgi:calcineurin-like phosphoesterase family protein